MQKTRTNTIKKRTFRGYKRTLEIKNMILEAKK